MVHVVLTDRGQRSIYVENGKVTSTDSGALLPAKREGDLTILELKAGERCAIPDAVVYGGRSLPAGRTPSALASRAPFLYSSRSQEGVKATRANGAGSD